MSYLVEYQGYLYFFGVMISAIGLYTYVLHLYRSEKRGEIDYEKYSNLALRDNIDDELVEENDGKKLFSSKK
jgi:cytochrome c oxidase cbb3-type subunit 4